MIEKSEDWSRNYAYSASRSAREMEEEAARLEALLVKTSSSLAKLGADVLNALEGRGHAARTRAGKRIDHGTARRRHKPHEPTKQAHRLDRRVCVAPPR